MRYYILENNVKDKSLAWVYDFPEEVGNSVWALREGMSCFDWFPSDTSLQIMEEKGIRIADLLPCFARHLFVSERIKQILDETLKVNIEFLPVTILDKKGRDIQDSYYLANVLEVIDCADMDRSEFRMKKIAKDQVDRFFRLVLKKESIDSDKSIFRIKNKTEMVIVSDEVVSAIENAGCSGMRFVPVECT